MVTTSKKKFVGKPQTSLEERQVNAQEFIAHYLDRIDDHLEGLLKKADENAVVLKKIEKHLSK